MMKYKRLIYIVIFFIGLGLILYPIISKKYNENLYNEIVDDFKKHTSNSTEEAKPKPDSDGDKFEAETLNPSDESGQDKEYTLEWAIANEGLIATIEIPSIKANLPIYYGTTNKILSKGVGLMKNGTAIIGGKDTHSVLAGHSGTASKIIFTHVHKLEKGDIFLINTFEGQLEYRVVDKRKMHINETHYLETKEDEDLVTLLTCPTFDSKRYRIIVRGERVIGE